MRKKLEELIKKEGANSAVPDWTKYEDGWYKDPRDQTMIYIKNGKPLFGGYGKTEIE